jgi:opacity protein-like surface antigen
MRSCARIFKNWQIVLALGTCFGLGSASAQAQEQPRSNTFEITPFAGFMAGGSFEEAVTGTELDVEDDSSYGVFFNLIADTPERQYELFYAKQSSVVEGGVPLDLDVQYLHLGGTVAYPQTRHIIPYFGATIGGTRFTPDRSGLDDETKLSFSVGGGARFPITDRIGIRFDVRAFFTLLENDSEFFCVSAPPSGTCLIKTSSDTFLQYMGSLGVSIGF